ncbi:phorbol ester/diacylglycerol-binding protein unc-13-like isoform X2 [Pseudophryne corroboree]|uniref:phorbol ester/diacylglycerol-binding protein unc-13-like isoform X2 n=1 Tax=Pseudophryne corroboree TaxID=495146 RepID=UPI0030814BF5
MVLLCVRVKKGHFNGISGNCNTYVIMKVQNLQSSTVPRPGSDPCWEQDYSFDLNDTESGLLVQVWKSSWLRDSILGSVWIPLQAIKHATDEGVGEWWKLYSEVITNGDEICGIKPTLHEILLDLFFAVPFGGMSENHDTTNGNEYCVTSDTVQVCHLSQNYILSTIKTESRNEDSIFTSSVAKERWSRAIQKVSTPNCTTAYAVSSDCACVSRLPGETGHRSGILCGGWVCTPTTRMPAERREPGSGPPGLCQHPVPGAPQNLYLMLCIYNKRAVTG